MCENDEVENLEEKISTSIRVKGTYQMPKSATYAPAIRILKKMEDEGLIESEEIGKNIIYRATEKMVKTILVREVSACKIKVGYKIGQKRGDFFHSINNRSKELSMSDIDYIGVVKSVETKEYPANIFERITFKKTALKTIIKFRNKTLIVNPDHQLIKVK